MDKDDCRPVCPSSEAASEQPVELREFLKAIAFARSQTSLYGKDHPNTQEALADLTSCLDRWLGNYGQLTCIFSEAGVVVNDRYHESSPDSLDMVDRLRHLGVMAITLIQGTTQEQIGGFLDFLNAEPRDVMAEAGPSMYLRRRGVTTIVVTEAVYTVEGKGDCSEGEPGEATPGQPAVAEEPGKTDRAIGAVIEWLADQDEAKEDPKFAVMEILADPDLAAALIREAVTKLHASRRPATAGEVATEVIHGLKNLAGDQSEDWDKHTSQVRKAVSKLPEDMRPALGGFSKPESRSRGTLAGSERIVDVGDVEYQVNQVLESDSRQSADQALGSIDVDQLFGASSEGMLSAWQKDLQADSYLRCSGRTLGTLMLWESSAAEHSRICRGLAALVPQALEIDDVEAAFELVDHLCDDVARDDGTAWRSANASSAIEQIDRQAMKSLFDSALLKESSHLIAIASRLVEAVPSLAADIADFLNRASIGAFRRSLEIGLVNHGRQAIPMLGNMLREGSTCGAQSALHCLSAIGDAFALSEIMRSLNKNDTQLLLKALELLPTMKSQDRVEWCVRFLSSRLPEVRLASLDALAKIGGHDAIECLRRIASRGGVGKTRTQEQVVAIEALGTLDSMEVVPDLERIARRRPLLGRSGYRAVAEAADKAIAAIRTRSEAKEKLAA